MGSLLTFSLGKLRHQQYVYLPTLQRSCCKRHVARRVLRQHKYTPVTRSTLPGREGNAEMQDIVAGKLLHYVFFTLIYALHYTFNNVYNSAIILNIPS